MGVTTSLELFKVDAGKTDDDAVSLVKQTLMPTVPSPLDYASASVIAELKSGDQVFLRLGAGALDVTRDRPLLYTGYMVYRLGAPVFDVVKG